MGFSVTFDTVAPCLSRKNKTKADSMIAVRDDFTLSEQRTAAGPTGGVGRGVVAQVRASPKRPVARILPYGNEYAPERSTRAKNCQDCVTQGSEGLYSLSQYQPLRCAPAVTCNL